MMGDPGLASKHVEAQIEDAERERYDRERGAERVLPCAETERRESLRLSVARVRAQLATARNEKHRRMLRKALRDLETDS